jgi:DNA invertase Pin-like site-specific DNA recombinase
VNDLIDGNSGAAGYAAPQRVVGYVRVSTGRQAQHNLSIPLQEEKIREYCAANNMELAQVFEDKARTGRNSKRPGLQALLGYTLSPENRIQAVIVYNYSRMMRRISHLENLIEKLNDANQVLLAVQQPLGKGAMADLMRRQIALYDQYESDVKAETTLDAMLYNARAGYWNGSTAPYGFEAKVVEVIGNRVKRRLAIDEKEAPIVRKIFELFRMGDGSSGELGCKAIARWLNQNDYRDRNGRTFTTKKVHAILRDETIAGTSIFNRRSSLDGRLKDQSEWVKSSVPAIVDPIVFAEVQERLSSKCPFKGQQPPRVISSPLLLSGLITCGSCHQHLCQTSGKGYYYYSCSHAVERTNCPGSRIPVAQLDPMVLDAVFARTFTNLRLADITTGLRRLMLERRGNLRQELDSARAQREKIVRDIDRHIDLGAKAAIDVVQDRIAEKLRNLAEERKTLEKRIRDLETRMQEARRRASRQDQLRFAAAFRQHIEQAPAPAVRAWLKTQIKGIVARGAEIHITYQ